MSNHSKVGDVKQAKRARAQRKGRPRGLKWLSSLGEDRWNSHTTRSARKSMTKSRLRVKK